MTASDLSSDSNPKCIRNGPYFVGKAASPMLAAFITGKYSMWVQGSRRLQSNIIGRSTNAVRSVRKQAKSIAGPLVVNRPIPRIDSNQIGHIGGVEDIGQAGDIGRSGRGSVFLPEAGNSGGKFLKRIHGDSLSVFIDRGNDFVHTYPVSI